MHRGLTQLKVAATSASRWKPVSVALSTISSSAVNSSYTRFNPILTSTRLQSTTVNTVEGEVEKKKHVKHKIPIKRFVFKPLNVILTD